MSDDQRTIELIEYDKVMSTSAGRNVMHRLLEFTGVDADSFDENPIITARNTGRRETGLWLIDELKETSPDKYMLMLKEHMDG